MKCATLLPSQASSSCGCSDSTMSLRSLGRSKLLCQLPRRNRLLLFTARKEEAFSFRAQCITTSTTTAPSPPKYSASRSRNLFSRISPVRSDGDVVRVLDEWVAEGRNVHPLEIQRIIRDLRSRRRFSQALKVSSWVSCNNIFARSSADYAVHLDLIGVVHGDEAAEKYFNDLNELNKNEKTYGALLNCYVREGLIEKTLHHMQLMKDKGYAYSSLAYNNLMALYKNCGQFEKVHEVFTEMKMNGIDPNSFSYRICIDAFGERSDLKGIEKLLEEAELQTTVDLDWATYSVAAYHFIKGNHKEKALTLMKRMEDKIDKDAKGFNNLISLNAHLGDKDGVMRAWNLQKFACNKQINRDYITVLGSLVKVGDLQTAEELLKQWDSSCRTYEFRVPNVLLIGYCQKGLPEKSEQMLRVLVSRGKKPTPNSWAIVASGYLDNGDLGKAFECMKEALAVKDRNLKWVPKPHLTKMILHRLSDKGKEKDNAAEAFMSSLKKVMSRKYVKYHSKNKKKLVNTVVEIAKVSLMADDSVILEEDSDD